jgi:hypothetical protein
MLRLAQRTGTTLPVADTAAPPNSDTLSGVAPGVPLAAFWHPAADSTSSMASNNAILFILLTPANDSGSAPDIRSAIGPLPLLHSGHVLARIHYPHLPYVGDLAAVSLSLNLPPIMGHYGLRAKPMHATSLRLASLTL